MKNCRIFAIFLLALFSLALVITEDSHAAALPKLQAGQCTSTNLTKCAVCLPGDNGEIVSCSSTSSTVVGNCGCKSLKLKPGQCTSSNLSYCAYCPSGSNKIEQCLSTNTTNGIGTCTCVFSPGYCSSSDLSSCPACPTNRVASCNTSNSCTCN